MTRKEQIIHAAKQAEKKLGFAQIVKDAKGVNSAYGIGFLEGAKWADEHSIEVKDVDLDLITVWFDHIAQIADDRMTLTNQRMTDAHALDEIKCLAKDSAEFINKYYKAQKGE